MRKGSKSQSEPVKFVREKEEREREREREGGREREREKLEILRSRKKWRKQALVSGSYRQED